MKSAPAASCVCLGPPSTTASRPRRRNLALSDRRDWRDPCDDVSREIHMRRIYGRSIVAICNLFLRFLERDS